MTFPTITGTIYSSMKMTELNMKWQQRKANPRLAKEKEEDPQRARMREDLENMRKGNILSSINSKLNAGAELTDEELAYLKQNSPGLYREAMEVKREREAYEKALKRCKTKDEVERLNANQMQKYLSQAKTVSNNPSLSKGEKRAQLEKILKRVMGIQSEHLKFVATKEYAELPREYEEKKKEKKEKETSLQLEKKEDLLPQDFQKVKDLLEQALSEAGLESERKETAPAETSSAKTSPETPDSQPEAAGTDEKPAPAPSLSVRV